MRETKDGGLGTLDIGTGDVWIYKWNVWKIGYGEIEMRFWSDKRWRKVSSEMIGEGNIFIEEVIGSFGTQDRNTGHVLVDFAKWLMRQEHWMTYESGGSTTSSTCGGGAVPLSSSKHIFNHYGDHFQRWRFWGSFWEWCRWIQSGMSTWETHMQINSGKPDWWFGGGTVNILIEGCWGWKEAQRKSKDIYGCSERRHGVSWCEGRECRGLG